MPTVTPISVRDSLMYYPGMSHNSRRTNVHLPLVYSTAPEHEYGGRLHTLPNFFRKLYPLHKLARFEYFRHDMVLISVHELTRRKCTPSTSSQQRRARSRMYALPTSTTESDRWRPLLGSSVRRNAISLGKRAEAVESLIRTLLKRGASHHRYAALHRWRHVLLLYGRHHSHHSLRWHPHHTCGAINNTYIRGSAKLNKSQKKGNYTCTGILGVVYHAYYVCIMLSKDISHCDFSVLSMSVMGFQKVWIGGGWVW